MAAHPLRLGQGARRAPLRRGHRRRSGKTWRNPNHQGIPMVLIPWFFPLFAGFYPIIYPIMSHMFPLFTGFYPMVFPIIFPVFTGFQPSEAMEHITILSTGKSHLFFQWPVSMAAVSLLEATLRFFKNGPYTFRDSTAIGGGESIGNVL